MNVIKGGSPIAWRQVNLIWTFEFNRAASKVDIDALAARYYDPVCWNKALQEEAEGLQQSHQPLNFSLFEGMGKNSRSLLRRPPD